MDGPANPTLVAAFKSPLHFEDFQFVISWDSVYFYDESAYVTGMSGVESVDSQTRQMQQTTVDVILDNSTGRYDPRNVAGPFYAYLNHTDQLCFINMGYNNLLARVGTYWVDEIIPSEIDQTCLLKLKDRGAKLKEKTVNFGPLANVLTSDVAVALLEAAGLVDVLDFEVEEGTTTCVFAYANNADPFAELQELAIAEGGRCYVDPCGVVRFRNRPTHLSLLGQSKVTIPVSSLAYDISYARKKQDIVTRVTLEYEDRLNAVVDEVVFILQTPAGVPAATSFTFNDALGNPQTAYGYGIVKLKLMGMDYTQWERYLPIQFTTVNTIVVRNSGGTPVPTTAGPPPDIDAGIANMVYYDIVADGSVSYLTLWNLTAAVVYATTLTVNGKPARAVSPYAVVADDFEGQTIPGIGVVEQSFQNAYLPTTDIAKVRAQELLAYREAVRTSIDLPAIDGIPFLHPLDTFTILDDTVVPNLRTTLFVLENHWDFSLSGGYTSDLVTGGSTTRLAPSTTQGVAGPTGANSVITTFADSNLVWKWGADAHALIWNESEWG